MRDGETEEIKTLIDRLVQLLAYLWGWKLVNRCFDVERYQGC